MPQKTVLVIEDNPLNMKLIRLMLKRTSFRMLEAYNAFDGIKIAKEELPDLILMDIQLPGMDGLQATQIIKDDPDLKDIPVIAITSYAMDGDEIKAIDAGCTDYITKPFDTKTFVERITQYL